MFVVGLIGVISVMAVPMTSNMLGNFRLDGDARNLTNAISLTKLRAASYFSKARLYVDRSAGSFHVETWDKTGGAWVADGGTTYLSTAGETFGSGVVGSPPPNTQAAVGMTQCLDATATAIANTACVVFNSRGIPVVDAAGSTGSPTANQAVYVTDGTAIFAATVTVTGVIRLWRTNPLTVPAWVQQ